MGSWARLLPSITCQKSKEKDITILELKQELAEEKNRLKDAIQKIEKLQNRNKRKKKQIVKDLQNFIQVDKIIEYLCGFILLSIKGKRNCSISGDIHLLLEEIPSKQKLEKIREEAIYPLTTVYF